MIINEQQILTLLLILKDSVSINISGVFSVSNYDRIKLLNQIVGQQSEELKVIE